MVLREAGVRLTLQGEAAYRAGLKGISQEMRTVATASKLAVAQLGNNAGITDTYNAKVKAMGSEMKIASTQSQVLTERQRRLPQIQKEITTSLEATNKVYKESATRTKELDVAYQKSIGTNGRYSSETIELGQALESSKQETKALEVEVNNLTKAFNNNEKELAKLPNELAKAELATQKLRNESQKLHDEWRNQGGRLADTAKQWQDVGNTLTTVGNKLTTVGSQMTTKVTLPIVTGMGLAVKGAAAFQTEMGTLLPLIAEGGNITEEHRAQVEQLGEASREMAIDYGKHTSDLNAGMAELIRNGYTSAQVLGMVPNVLDASIASGEEFQTVMGTTANVLSQFQLRGKDTNETLENTQRVVDSLTYVANATSSGFYDLGQGMAYVGPVANSLNMSVEETASILGILSDNGIEASQGGTALRGALTRLLKPSKQNAEAMAELGISTEDYKNGLIEFPEILDLIATNTAHLTDEQRAALIATAFGTEAQSAMNALVAAGGDELRNMTTAAEGATGATKEIAEAIKDTPEFQFQQSLAQLRDLGIELGSKLLPSVMKIISAAGDWVESFNSLSESTQNFIIKLALGVAAIGPLVTAIGSIYKVAGMTATGIGGLIKVLGRMTTPKAITQTAAELGKIPGAATTAGGSATLFSVPWLGAVATVTAAVAGLGLIIYTEATKYDRSHQESVKETEGAYQTWFDAVVQGSVDAAEAQTKIQDATQVTGRTYEEVAKEIKRRNHELQDNIEMAWEDMYITNPLTGQLEWFDGVESKLKDVISSEDIDAINAQFNGLAIMLTGSLQEIGAQYQRQEVVSTQWARANVENIQTVANSTKENLAIQRDALLEEARLNAQYESNSTQWLAEQTAQIESQYAHRVQVIDRATATISEILMNAAKSDRALTDAEMVSMVRSIQDFSKVSGQSLSELGEVGETVGEALRGLSTDASLGFLEAEGVIDKSTADMIRSMIDAEERTNALWDALQEYDQFDPEYKEIEIDSSQVDEALRSIEELAEAWNDLTFEEKRAEVETRGKEDIDELLERLGVDWESLTPTQKEYYAQAEGGEALENILYLTNEWDRSTDPKTKYAVLETQIDNEALLSAIEMRDLWNNADFMSLAMEIDTNAPDAEAQLINLVNYFSSQLGLPPLQMETEALTEESQQKLAELIAAYTGAPVDQVLEFITETNAGETSEEVNEFSDAIAGIPPESRATFTTDVGGVGADAEEVDAYGTAVENVPESKSSDLSTNTFETIANTLAVLAYNEATGAMEDKDVSADTSISSMIRNTVAVLAYNSAVNGMRNKSSTLTTNTPNIALNTSRASSWVRALNSAYNRTSTLTTVYRTQGSPARGFATGGHIDAYAEGGDIKWGGLFAGGAQNVPKGYMGIVGEAGPEMFHVTRDGVNITPLSPGEKMRGVEGAIEDYLGKAKGGGDTHFHIEINGPVVKDKQDINALAREVSREIGKQVNNRQKGWSVQL